MKARKGRFTVPNLMTVVILLFLFAVFFQPMQLAFNGLSDADTTGGILAYAVMQTLPALLALAIFATPWILRERKRIIREQNGGERR